MRLAILIACSLDKRSAIAVSEPASYTETKALFDGFTKGEADDLYDRAPEFPVLQLWTDGSVRYSRRLKKDVIAAKVEAEEKAKPEEATKAVTPTEAPRRSYSSTKNQGRGTKNTD